MAVIDISEEIQAFLTAIYGRDVRSSMVSLAQKLTEACEDAIENQLISVDSTLTQQGQGADAAAVGLKLREINKVSVAEDEQHTTITVDSDGSTEYYVVPNDGIIGRMSALETDNKGTVVGAINELKTLIETIQPDFSDGSVTTAKLANHAVTMDKTDFYYSGSISHNYSWVQKTYYSNSHRCTFKWSEMATILTEFPETLSIVMADVVAGSTNWYQGSPTDLRLSTTSHNQIISRTSKTFTVNGVNYGVMEFKRSDFETAYNALKSYVENDGESWTDYTYTITNVASRIPIDGDVYYIAGEVTSELIELNFSTTVISSDFVSAVQAAMSGGSGSGTSSYEEELAKARLTGKVMINFGDSYTKNMATFCSTLATKYGMVADDQGTNGATVIGNFPTKANDVVTAYTNGRTIGGVTYHAEDVAFITFMGGANDGAGIETYIGTGLSDTSTSRIYGAVQSIFKLFANTFTNAKIIVIAQPANYNQQVSSFTTEAQATALGFASLADLQRYDDYQLSEYMMYNKEKAIMEVAKAYSFPLIDMFSNFPSMLNPANRTAYWQSDKIHVNTAGSQLIVNALEKKIVELTVG